MDKKKIIIIGLIIIILAACFILISSQNNTNDYNPSNNTTESNISNDTTKNSSLNTNQITKSGKNAVSRINDNQTTGIEEKSSYSNNQQFNEKKNGGFSPTNNTNNENKNNLDVTADDIKKRVEEGVGWPNYGKDEVVIGDPYLYTNFSWGSTWLVPAFDKNTGKFIGSVLVHSVSYKKEDGSFSAGFSHGTESYSVYLDVISGKPFPNPYEPIGNITVEYESNTLDSSNPISNAFSIDGNNTLEEIMLDGTDVNVDLSDGNIDLNKSCCE